MVYQGGKFRQSKHIAPIINLCIKENNISHYYEPFAGGLNVLDKIKCENLYANDIDTELIDFYNFIKNGGIPLDDCSRELYHEIKNGNNNVLKGNIKYLASFGGKPWGGWGWRNDNQKTHYKASLNNFIKQIPMIKITNFSNLDYLNLEIPDGAFVYCDPPYKNTTGYETSINCNEFYNWVKRLSKRCYVIISEYQMPDDFICFKSISYKKCLSATDNSTQVNDNLYYCEGLFKEWYEGGNKND